MILKRLSNGDKIGNVVKKKKFDLSDFRQGSLKGFFLKISIKKEVVDIKMEEVFFEIKGENYSFEMKVKIESIIIVKSNIVSVWKNFF